MVRIKCRDPPRSFKRPVESNHFRRTNLVSHLQERVSEVTIHIWLVNLLERRWNRVRYDEPYRLMNRRLFGSRPFSTRRLFRRAAFTYAYAHA